MICVIFLGSLGSREVSQLKIKTVNTGEVRWWIDKLPAVISDDNRQAVKPNKKTIIVCAKRISIHRHSIHRRNRHTLSFHLIQN